MLERMAQCLESGSFQCFLPLSLKPLTSRRMLHSSFWNHGRTDLKLSPWNSFFHGTFIINEDRNMSLKQRVDVVRGLFLDFLYPAGALRFPSQRSSRRSDRQKNQWLYTRLSGLG